MKGERTIDSVPFRFSGMQHGYEMTSEDWADYLPEHMSKCYICGGQMRNISVNGVLLKKTYPYMASFKITKGKNKGEYKFRPMCRACAYDFGKGVIEMDGHTYTDREEFKEERFKEAFRNGICWNCKHCRQRDDEEWVCIRKGSIIKDIRIRECDEMWEAE